MKRLIFTAGLSFVIVACNTNCILASEPPTSAEQLRSEVELALKTQNTKAIMALFNWDEIQEKDVVKMLMKAAFEEEWNDTNKVISVKLSPLPANYRATNEMFSLRTRDNVTVVGMIEINRTDKNYDEHLPYGTKGGVFYIAQTVRETIPGKSLRVTVSVFSPPIAYTGSCVYVKEGKEIDLDLNGTNKYIEQNLWGDYIKSCTIQKTTTTGLIMLEIAEDHKKIFQSPQIRFREPIVYNRKATNEPPASAEELQKEQEFDANEQEASIRNQPVKTGYRIDDDCILVLQNYTKEKLPLTVTATLLGQFNPSNPSFNKTNSCQMSLDGGATKDVDLLAGWIITPDDRIRVTVVNPYSTSFIDIINERTPNPKIAEPQETILKEFNETKI